MQTWSQTLNSWEVNKTTIIVEKKKSEDQSNSDFLRPVTEYLGFK